MGTRKTSATLIALAITLATVALLSACDKGDNGDDQPRSKWGKPLTVIEYQDASATSVWETTTYFYDLEGRLTGYKSVNWNGHPNEEMLNSRFEGAVHTYDLHSYEWIGTTLPVVFHRTDTYTDATFTTIASRYTKARNMNMEETITYTYDGGRQTCYRTVVEGSYPDDYLTRIAYIIDPRPSAKKFPVDVEDEANRIEMFYTDRNGNRTGYYNDNDYSRAQWNFEYHNGYCTYYTSRWGDIDRPHLVRVVFLPEGR